MKIRVIGKKGGHGIFSCTHQDYHFMGMPSISTLGTPTCWPNGLFLVFSRSLIPPWWESMVGRQHGSPMTLLLSLESWVGVHHLPCSRPWPGSLSSGRLFTLPVTCCCPCPSPPASTPSCVTSFPGHSLNHFVNLFLL